MEEDNVQTTCTCTWDTCRDLFVSMKCSVCNKTIGRCYNGAPDCIGVYLNRDTGFHYRIKGQEDVQIGVVVCPICSRVVSFSRMRVPQISLVIKT